MASKLTRSGVEGRLSVSVGSEESILAFEPQETTAVVSLVAPSDEKWLSGESAMRR